MTMRLMSQPMIGRPASFAIFASALLAVSPAIANPQPCQGVALSLPGTVVLNYDPFDQSRETLDVEIGVTTTNSEGACDIGLAVQSARPGVYRELRGTGVTVNYEVRSGNLLVQNDLANPISVRVLPQGSKRDGVVRIRFEIPPGLLVGAGDYDDLLTIRAFDLSSGSPRSTGSDVTLTLKLVVPPSVRLLVDGPMNGGGGSFGASIIDLGDLQDGATESATLQVRATAGVRLSINSENDGYLLHVGAHRDAAGIAYRLSIDGQPTAIADGAAFVTRPRQPVAGRYNVRLTVTVPPSPQRLAGIYRDRLTITAEPN